MSTLTNNFEPMELTMKKLAVMVGAVTGVLSLTVSTVNASVLSETKSAQIAFRGVSTTELPAQAALFVSHKGAKAQVDAAVGAMKAAIAANPSSAATVLASIVKAAPATAPQVVVAAVQALPSQVRSLAQTAAKNAPDYAAQIGAALAGLDRQAAQLIAEAISEVVPSTSSTVLLASMESLMTPAAIDRVPAPRGEAAKSLSAATITVGGNPYVPGGSTPLVANLKVENANSQRGYTTP